MKMKIEINMNNAAFGENGENRTELERILNRIAISVFSRDGGNILDINDNQVGTWDISE